MHKFKNSPVFLPISHEERVKEVFFESGGRINIHCETIEIELILFTICVKYAKAPFHLSHFVKSLGNSKYETPMKDIEEQVDRKMWVNKKGHLISAKPMAFKIRQVVLSIAMMMALDIHVTEQMRPVDLTGHVLSQGRS
jgi:hypothetical protein